MMEVYTATYHTGILTECCKNWDEHPNVENTWENFHSNSMDAQLNMWRKQKQMDNQMGFHGENAMLREELERSNSALLNMAQTAMTDK